MSLRLRASNTSPTIVFTSTLFQSTKSGDTDRIHQLVRNNKKLKKLALEIDFDEFRDGSFKTLLICASENGRLEIADMLIADCGVDVNARDIQGRTALMYAAFGGFKLLVALLLDRGAVIDARDEQGETALMHACRQGRDRVVNLIIGSDAYGMQLNAQDKKGRTPLMLAALYSQLDTVQLLLELGSDVLIRDRNGKTAIDLARLAQNNRAVIWLLENYRKSQIRQYSVPP